MKGSVARGLAILPGPRQSERRSAGAENEKGPPVNRHDRQQGPENMQSNAGARGSVLDAGKGAEPGAALKLGRTLARTLRQRLRCRERRGATLRPTTDRGAPGPGSCLGRQSREQGSRYQPTGCVQGQPRRCARRLTSTRLRLIPTSGVVRRRVRFPLAPPRCRSQLVPSWQAPRPRH
jgi:hypothetical protein